MRPKVMVSPLATRVRLEPGVDVGAQRGERAGGRVEQADRDGALGAGGFAVVLRAAVLVRRVLPAASGEEQQGRGGDRGNSQL
ncbi:hypothetical protein [Streptodolium elevatio]